MHFLYPSFLFALFTLAIPLVIHLFYFRRFKKVVFSDLRFLKQVEEVTRSNRKLRDLLVLLARMLALTFLVLAFAQPFIPKGQSGGRQSFGSVLIYLDNSASMLLEGKEGNLFETAKNKARAIVNALNPETGILLLTNDGGASRMLRKNEAIAKIDEAKISSKSKRIDDVQRIAANTPGFHLPGNNRIYVISDFQQAFIDPSAFKPDTSFQWSLLLTQAGAPQNISVDSCWITSPFIKTGQPVNVGVRVSNHTDSRIEGLPVTMRINGMQKDVRNLTLDAHAKTDAMLSFTPATSEWMEGEIVIEDHPLTFDDKLFFTLKPGGQARVLSIRGAKAGPFTERLFSGDPDYRYTQVQESAIDYSQLKDQQLIILDGVERYASGLATELEKYVREGGQVLFIPASETFDRANWNNWLGSVKSIPLGEPQQAVVKVERLNLVDPVFRDVFIKLPDNPDLPVIKQYYPLTRSSQTAGRPLLKLNNGDPFLWMNRFAKGSVVVLAVPLDAEYSNFQQHALFVPTLLKLGLGVSGAPDLYFTIGKGGAIPVKQQGLAPVKVVSLFNDRFNYTGEMINGKEWPVPQNLEEAGVYKLGASKQEVLARFAFNYNRSESVMQFWSGEPAWEGIHTSDSNGSVIGAEINQSMNGIPLWRWMLLGCLLFVLTEVFLLRWMKA